MRNPTDSAFRVVRVLALRQTRTWLGLVFAAPQFDGFLGDLESELSAQTELTIRIVDSGALSVSDLTSTLERDESACVALTGLEAWEEERWRDLDINRNALDRTGPLLFCLTPEAADSMARFAPNVRSYLGSFHVIGPDKSGMSEEEVQERLTALREFYGLTDQEVIAKAQSGTLPPGAHFVEWLILLDRGDLV